METSIQSQRKGGRIQTQQEGAQFKEKKKTTWHRCRGTEESFKNAALRQEGDSQRKKKEPGCKTNRIGGGTYQGGGGGMVRMVMEKITLAILNKKGAAICVLESTHNDCHVSW